MKTKSRSVFKILAVPVLAATVISTLNAGSLWRDGITDERGMFADKRAKRIGDIVTIVVQETATLSNSLNTTTNKTNSDAQNVVGNLVNQFITALPNTVLGKKITNAANNGTIVAPSPAPLSVTGTTAFTGGGQIQNTQTITAQAAVEVIDVLPNGNLVIEGVREISFSKEKQFESLHGIIRPYDIQPNNTVLSSNVADAQIDIVSEGTLTDAQKKGWLQRLNDKVNPF
jgi:flagellar L-ring protein precursor FlgH